MNGIVIFYILSYNKDRLQSDINWAILSKKL